MKLSSDAPANLDKLIESSKEVIKDASLENGAIVAGNTDKEYYPQNVQNYRFVWLRDNAFILEAAKILDLDVREDFLDWMLDRMEDFSETGIVYHRYLTNGPRDPQFGHQFQPDQAGALIWSLRDAETQKEKKVVKLLAEGLIKTWKDKNFDRMTYDPWEERSAFAQNNESFIYSLAACSEGLKQAYKLIGKAEYQEVSNEMRNKITQSDYTYYPKSLGVINDESIDGSTLGLIWPFNQDFDKNRLENTLNMVEDSLLTDQGVKRYQNDMYDSMLESTSILMKGAGGWPVLTFWYHTTLTEIGREEEAKKKFSNYLTKFNGKYIPEQVFETDKKNSVKPLVWSHAMLIIAAERLDYI